MKPLLIFTTLLLAVSATSFAQTQNSFFVIGAEWLNYPYGNRALTAADWNNIQDLGLNWGMVGFQNTDAATIAANATAALNGAAARNIFLHLFTGTTMSDAAEGRRWQYHPEYAPNMLGGTRTGRAIQDPTNSDAKTMPEQPKSNQIDSWQASTTLHQEGYVITGVVRDANEYEPDGFTYYLKIRARLQDPIPDPSTEVFTITLLNPSGNVSQTRTILVSDFSSPATAYQEITAFSFNKLTSGVPQIYQSKLDQLGMVSVQDYAQNSGADNSNWQYQVYWHGNVTCFVDYLIVDDQRGHETFTLNTYDTAIQQIVDGYKTNNGLGRYKISDEPAPSRYLAVGHVENVIRARLSGPSQTYKTGTHFNTGYGYYTAANGEEFVRRNLEWTGTAQNLADVYPINYTLEKPGDAGYEGEFQTRIQDELVSYLRTLTSLSVEYNRPFWFTPQLHNYTDTSGNHVLREPTNLEIRAMVNLAIAYGAKGIHYFPYYSLRDHSPNNDHEILGLVEEDGTPRLVHVDPADPVNKWDAIKALNARLSSLGPTLITLSWQGAKSWHNGATTTSWSGYVTNVTTNVPGETIYYVETGHFRDGQNVDYLFVVNRRTLSTESRDVTLSLSNSEPKKVTDVLSGSSWTIAASGSFVASLGAGEGRLYKVSATPPPAPVLASPASGASNVSTAALLTWNSSAGATSYHLQIGTGSDFSSSTLMLEDSTITTTSLAVGLVPSTTYYWKVRARNAAGWGAWSETRSFTSSSTLASGTTWKGTMLLAQNVTVPAGVTLTINSGTTVKSSPAVTLTVNGVLSANGVTFTSASGTAPGSWGAIYFDGSGTSNSILRNCTMQYGHSIQCRNGANVTIDNCVVQRNGYGVVCNGSSPVISNNQILYNVVIGITVAMSGNLRLENNTITNNDISRGSSVSLYTSSAYANSNIISGSYYGLSSTYASYLCGWSGTDPNYTPAQNNKVFGAKYGISADNQSSTLMGQSGRGGNNWIENNIVADLGSWSGSVLYGLGNWYGSDLTATTEKTADATLTWSALSANPWGPQAKVVSAGLYASSLEISSSAHSSSVQISQGKNSDDKLFEEAVADHACKLYGKAQAKYKQLLSSKRYSHSVLVLLGHLCRESADNSILSYFEDLKTNAVSNKTDKSNIPLIANLLANMHGMQGNYTKAIELYDEVMKKYPNTLEERKARVQKIYYLMEGMKDKTGAKQQLAELLSRYTDGGDDIEMIKDLVNFPVLAALDVSRSSLGKSMKESVQEEKEVAEYSLSANYPNPFNPSTTISYQLPAAGHVILKVYDVLGREVLTLVDEIKDAGSHTATFDGSKFSSGIYFTRFAVQPLDGSKPFVQTQKMLLSK